MGVSGYMDYDDFKTIWGSTILEARFNLINVRMGEILNFIVRADKDAQTDITNTKVLPMLEEASEEGLVELLQATKTNKFSDVWQFVQSNSVSVMSKMLFKNRQIIKEIKEVLESKVQIKYSNLLRLPSHSDDRRAV